MISVAVLGFLQGVIYDIGIFFYNSDSLFYVCFLYDINMIFKWLYEYFFHSHW